jgi:outer membrane protein OmpA-like peptidoglycan-associated protein
MKTLLAALLILSSGLWAGRDAVSVVLGDDAQDCDCPLGASKPTAIPTAIPTATATAVPEPLSSTAAAPEPSPVPTVDSAVKAIQDLGFKAVWIEPGLLLVTLSDESARFAKGSANLSAEALDRVKQLSALLGQYPGSTAAVTGHSDRKGNSSYNVRLSERRAQKVADVMVSQGVPAGSITSVKGEGPNQPLNTDGSEEGEAMNRRVEIRMRMKGMAGN